MSTSRKTFLRPAFISNALGIILAAFALTNWSSPAQAQFVCAGSGANASGASSNNVATVFGGTAMEI